MLALFGCGVGVGGELGSGDASIGSTGHLRGADGGVLLGDDNSGSSSGSGDDSGVSMDDEGGGGSSSGASSGGGDDSGGPPMQGPPSDAGPNCNFAGTWATKISINVNWVPQGIMGVILAPGSGLIQQWILSTRVVTGKSTVDTASVCGITLPDFAGTSFAGGETYGVRFPDSLFDNGYIPQFAIPGNLSNSSPSAAFTTSPTAVLIGLTLANATTATWPSTVTTDVDMDKDGHPGVTANAASGPLPDAVGPDAGSYENIPVDIFKDRASSLYLVIRQVTALSGAATDCDHFSGGVTIPRIPATASGKYAIDSHVIGCGLEDNGGDCSASQASFVDGTQPIFSPTGTASFASVRMTGATCATVRQALP